MGGGVLRPTCIQSIWLFSWLSVYLNAFFWFLVSLSPPLLCVFMCWCGFSWGKGCPEMDSPELPSVDLGVALRFPSEPNGWAGQRERYERLGLILRADLILKKCTDRSRGVLKRRKTFLSGFRQKLNK